MTNNRTGANTGMPGKTANGTAGMLMTSSAAMRGGNATVLPPEPVFTTRGGKTKSEAGRGGGRWMGGLVGVGLGVWGVMVLL